MQLGVGALAAGNPTGLGRLCRNAVIGLAAAASDTDLHVFLRDAKDVELIREEAGVRLRNCLDSVSFHISDYPRIPILQRLQLEQKWIPARARELALDAYLGCDFTLPQSLDMKRRMVILPDMLPYSLPQTVSLPARILYRRAISFAVKSGAGLLCISEATRRAVIERFPQAEQSSITLLPPVSPMLWTYASRSDSIDLRLQVQGSRHMFASNRPFLLAVGTRGLRKNTGLLARIYRELVLSGDYSGSLVLTGGSGEFHTANSSPKLAVVTLSGDQGDSGEDAPAIHDIGRVSEFDLSRLYRSADLLVSLSVEEGFGYPVLESLAHGTPALVSRGSAMAEIAPGGIVQAGLDPADARVKLLSTLNALPLLRREAAELDLQKYSVEEYGRMILRLFEEMEN